MDKFTIRVPASTANLGAGFDVLGMAVSLYNDFTFEKMEEGFEISGTEDEFSTKDNIIYQAFLKTFDIMKKSPCGIKINISGDIPISRGLGSSAACIVAGVMVALYIIGEGEIDRNKLLDIATKIEGHPDNVAPAIFGGLVVSLVHEGRVIYQDVAIKDEVELAVLVPNFRLSTEEARKVLPQSVSFKDAVFNLSRLGLFISSLCAGSFENLDIASQDALHQNRRATLIPDFDKIMQYGKEAGSLAGFLSGAGPSIMFMVRDAEDFSDKMNEKTDEVWTAIPLKVDNTGAVLL